MTSTQRSGSAAIIIILLIAIFGGGGAYWYFSQGSAEEELLPGEAVFNEHLEAAEAMVESSSKDCDQIQDHWNNAVEAFKEMMPHLKGFALKRRDERLGAVRSYLEGPCRK